MICVLNRICNCRFNKHIKGLVKNPQMPEINLAFASTRDTAAQYQSLKLSGTEEAGEHRSRPRPSLPHGCVLWGRESFYDLTRNEVVDLRICGCDIDDLSMAVTSYPIAYIMGVHFRSGEWDKHPWCGSVITCVLDGRSLYARVNAFIYVDGDECPGYASVTWFSEPSYLLGGRTPLVVRVELDGSDIDRQYGSILRITQIDPSQVIVEPDPDNECYMMMRDSGYDTRMV